jgi:hypothetical protein
MRGHFLGAGLAAVAAASAPLAGRIYGYENIRRHLQRQKPNHSRAAGSIAGLPHKHEREIARRLRQETRNKERQRARFTLLHPRVMAEIRCDAKGTETGISRRNRFVVA